LTKISSLLYVRPITLRFFSFKSQSIEIWNWKNQIDRWFRLLDLLCRLQKTETCQIQRSIWNWRNQIDRWFRLLDLSCHLLKTETCQIQRSIWFRSPDQRSKSDFVLNTSTNNLISFSTSTINLIPFSRSLLSLSVKRDPWAGDWRLEIGWHFKCNRLCYIEWQWGGYDE